MGFLDNKGVDTLWTTAKGKFLAKSGGTLTGNLTGQNITGTLLQTTKATDLGKTPSKIAVLDDSGKVCYRTPSEILKDIGTESSFVKKTYDGYPYGSSSYGVATRIFHDNGEIELYASREDNKSKSLKVTPTGVTIDGIEVATKNDITVASGKTRIYSAVGFVSGTDGINYRTVSVSVGNLLDITTGVSVSTAYTNGRDSNLLPKKDDIVIFEDGNGLMIGYVTADVTLYYSGVTASVKITYYKGDNWNSWCLEQGTMIAMADGTQKPIEEVRNGDLLLSYDFETKKPTTAVCMLAVQTRSDYHANYIAFDNDIVLGIDVQNSHEVYNVTKGCFTSCKHELDVGDYGLDINGNEVEFIGPMDWISDGKLKAFYNIVSSNNCYYANNLLIAHDPFCKKSWVERYSKEEIPDELKELIELDSMETKKKNYLVENKEVMYKLIKVYSKIEKCFVQLGAIKNKLTATDYVSNKASEGYESEKINTILEERKQLRLDYNRIEAEKIELEKEYDDLRVKYSPLGKDVLLSEFELRSKLFHEACKRDNEAFELFNKHFGKRES